MDNTGNKIWFQESTMIDSNVESIIKSLSDIGQHYKKLVSVYPGITTAEIIEQGKDYVIIKTNEGTMKRTNISVNTLGGKIVVEFDEEYITSKITSNSHFVENFQEKNDSIELNIEISNHVATGFLGFFLRNFGSKNIGNGFLNSYRKIFDK
jgi:hypothetical protein